MSFVVPFASWLLLGCPQEPERDVPGGAEAHGGPAAEKTGGTYGGHPDQPDEYKVTPTGGAEAYGPRGANATSTNPSVSGGTGHGEKPDQDPDKDSVER